jgi:hypothetical protein
MDCIEQNGKKEDKHPLCRFFVRLLRAGLVKLGWHSRELGQELMKEATFK